VALGCGPQPTRQAVEPAAGEPIPPLPAGSWSWVDFPDSSCDDGTPTGIGVNPGTSGDLVVVLNGGGACWDYLTCFAYPATSHGPFGAAEFAALGARELPGSILDRSLPGNPYREATLVFVPYCTGDIHGGDAVVTYVGGSDVRTFRHVGHANLVAFLGRLAPTFPAPRRLVVAGASAGGFGALLNYDTFRSAWPSVPAVLVDDSGPPLVAGAVPQPLLDAWYARWRIDRLLDPLCGSACRTDLSAALSALARRHPADRLALLSSLQDEVISGYFLLGPTALEPALRRLATEAMQPTPNARAFYVAGSDHALLRKPAAYVQGVSLLQWLEEQWSLDPSWGFRSP